MYEFNDQLAKGKEFEKHFFNLLNEQKQMPKYNNFDGDNKEFDIEANGKKYEVKADLYENKTFPIEILHFFPTEKMFKSGWIYETKSDFIPFYKPHYQEIYYLHTKNLVEFTQANLLTKNLVPTPNKNKLTYNILVSADELEQSDVVKRIDKYLN